MQAVSPPPDGGYPGGNTAEGQAALLSLTTGGFNTAVGFFSLRSDSTNSFNTAIGAGTLLANTADKNTAIGAGALLTNITGDVNTATGTFALFFNTTGHFNAAVGGYELHSNTIGDGNTATGWSALASNTTGVGNTAVGDSALNSNTTGISNTAVGADALFNNTTGNVNTALGHFAGDKVSTASHVICIGASGADVDNITWIGNVYGTTTQSSTTLPVIVSSDGQLCTMSSSRRFKKEIKPMGSASETILGLQPVTFHYKIDTTGTPQFGLVAEDVAKIDPNLVVRDDKGEIYSVRYDAVNAMLLNEFLKEHNAAVEERRKVEKLEATVANLVATVKEQAAQIQKVSARFEADSRPAQMVSNDR